MAEEKKKVGRPRKNPEVEKKKVGRPRKNNGEFSPLKEVSNTSSGDFESVKYAEQVRRWKEACIKEATRRQAELKGNESDNAIDTTRYKRKELVRKSSVGDIPTHMADGVMDSDAYRVTEFTIRTLQIADGVDISDVDDMRGRFFRYMELAAEMGFKLSNLAAYSAIGISKNTASQWRLQQKRESQPEFKKLIELIDAACSISRETLAADGKINPAIAIFWAKNFDGMKDVQDVVVKPENPLGERKDAKQIAERYKDLIED